MGSNEPPEDDHCTDTHVPSAAWTAWLANTMWYATSTRPRQAAQDRRPDRAGGSELRVSDAERGEVIDLLAKHFGEGRLDQQELDDRLQLAMSAKTRGDLSPLLADMPEATGKVAATAPSRWPQLRRDFVIPAPIVGALAALGALLLLSGTRFTGLGGFLLLSAVFLGRRYRRARARRLWHDHLHEHGTSHWHGPKGPVVTGPPPGHGHSPRYRNLGD
ncbi:MAG: DUF1707 SHOCT-like domain-containing protein [Acidimicrobiales bacterium]